VRSGGRRDLHHCAEWHHFAGRIAHLQSQNVIDTGPKRRIGLRDDLIGSAETVEVIDIDRAKIGLHGVENVLHLDTQLHCLDAIDACLELRHPNVEIRNHRHQPRSLGRFSLDLAHHAIERLITLISTLVGLAQDRIAEKRAALEEQLWAVMEADIGAFWETYEAAKT